MTLSLYGTTTIILVLLIRVQPAQFPGPCLIQFELFVAMAREMAFRVILEASFPFVRNRSQCI
jgi:hypothetical protein